MGGIAGGIVFFFLGYLFYGTLFSDFFSKNGGSAPTWRGKWINLSGGRWFLVIYCSVFCFLM